MMDTHIESMNEVNYSGLSNGPEELANTMYNSYSGMNATPNLFKTHEPRSIQVSFY